MNTNKTICTAVAATVAAALIMIGSPVYAQRDAGAKIRGDYSFGASQPRYYSRGFVEPQRSFSYAPAETPAVRRSYSYEPSYETGRRSSSPTKPLWEYQKTDPRRYRP